ncbi:MAG TPA: hypothetical protein VHE37_11100, partial [Nevskiaceae bacterium]|nr:hypothetical protein [Nevskiaceae bacterium]
ITGDSCSNAALPAGSSCSILLRFAPTQVGALDASILVQTSDSRHATELIRLHGEGQASE